MITVALTATIDATGECVWRALLDPALRPRWDDRILGEIRLPRGSDRVLHGVRRARATGHVDSIRRACWRFRLAGIPLVMVEEFHRIEGHDRLLGRISIGSMHFDQTITLHAESDSSGPRTRLGMKLVASNSIAVIGELVPRLEVQRIVIEYADTTLRQVRKFCEGPSNPDAAIA
ncbi:MAG: SRPBCC family protein [Deltaproteobacteria bacterium]|nr:SRPBCC family protein [Deltaproteobacteria bacterium]